jgi:hypothetical protein
MCDYKFSHGFEDYGLLGYNTVQFGTGIQRFHRNLLPSSSTLKLEAAGSRKP